MVTGRQDLTGFLCDAVTSEGLLPGFAVLLAHRPCNPQPANVILTLCDVRSQVGVSQRYFRKIGILPWAFVRTDRLLHSPISLKISGFITASSPQS